MQLRLTNDVFSQVTLWSMCAACENMKKEDNMKTQTEEKKPEAGESRNHSE